MKNLFLLIVFMFTLTLSSQTIYVASVTSAVKDSIHNVNVYVPEWNSSTNINVVPDCANNKICSVEEIEAYNSQYRVPYGKEPFTYTIIEFCPPPFEGF